MNKVIYHLSSRDYHAWTPEERHTVEEFLRAHDIEPGEVPIGDSANSIVVRAKPSGVLEIDMWVHDLQDGKRVKCPTCPGCVRQKRIKRDLKTPLPKVSAAYEAEGWAAIGVAR